MDGFLDGSVPEEVYRDVMGEKGPSLVRAQQYFTRVVQLVDELGGSAVGRLFLTHLDRIGPRTAGILICPSAATQPRSDALHGMIPVKPADAFAKGTALPRQGPNRGTGLGTSVRITFDPAISVSDCGFLGGPDAILFHELAHAMRALAGTMLHKRMNRYDLFEEFVAITLTNLLLSERGQPLRDGHDCKAQQMSLADFCAIYQRPLKQMKDDAVNLSLFTQLGQLPALRVAWNPFRGW